MPKLKFILILLPIFFISGTIHKLKAQSEDNLTRKEKRKLRAKYINVGVGTGGAVFRDFATSPLFYRGSLSTFSLSYLSADKYKETEAGAAFSPGFFLASSNDNLTTSLLFKFNFFYSQLHRLKVLSNDKFNTKVGFMVDNFSNVRINRQLMNNALGLEFFMNAFGSVKVTKDISRKEIKHKKFLFIKYRLKPKKRKLSFRLNVGILNNALRNGYVYIDQSALLNKFDPLAAHELKTLSGIRLRTELNFTRFLKNKNGIRLSYVWDACKTTDFTDNFEMAYHIVKFSFLFNLNNR